jgi:Family of unknown function (DUF5808)
VIEQIRLKLSLRGGRRCGTADRDDDRFWKAGLVYFNRGDPALLVPARIGVGWTLNLASPAAWLLITAIIAAPAGLAAILSAPYVLPILYGGGPGNQARRRSARSRSLVIVAFPL